MWKSKIRFFSMVGSESFLWFHRNNTNDKGAIENEWKYMIPGWTAYLNYRGFDHVNHYINDWTHSARARGADMVLIDASENDEDETYEAQVSFQPFLFNKFIGYS